MIRFSAEADFSHAVAEKTKEQASQLGGVVLSGAGNIAAATGLMKKDEFPSDMNVRLIHQVFSVRRLDGFLSSRGHL